MVGASTVMPKKPRTTEGMPASTSISGFRISRAQPGATSRTKTAVATPSGQADDDRREGHQQRAQDQRHGPELIEGGIPARAEKVLQRHLEKGRHPLTQQEQENQDDEGD